MATNLKGNGITLARQAAFVSVGRIGTGAIETVLHGLGVTPFLVLVQLRDTIGAANQATIGTATKDSVPITVTLNGVYDLIFYVKD